MKYFHIITTLLVGTVLGFFVSTYVKVEEISQKYSKISKKLPLSDRDSYHSKYSKESALIRMKNYLLASKLIEFAKAKNIILVTAESVTGGNLASTLARSPGAGDVFAGGAVCYKIEAKKELLLVPDKSESELYDLQTAQDMARGTQKLYNISPKNKVSPRESYCGSKIMAIATTGRAVSWKKWEGGVYVAVASPDGKIFSRYFPHKFNTSENRQDRARTKDEGMLVATNKALKFALEMINKVK